jgi:ankyrin repeat protein
VDEESDLGETPLHLVSRGEYDSQERGVHIAQLLLEHGADINPKEKDLTTPLHLARSFGRLEIAGVLLNYDVKRQQRTAEI